MNKLVIFDLDGTLVDSLEDIRFALNTALKEVGYPEHDSESVRQKVGHGLGELVRAAVPHGSEHELIDRVLWRIKELYLERPYRFSEPYAGIVELVERLRAAGNYLAVLTNKAQAIASEIVSHFFPGKFTHVQGENPYIPRKPDPRCLEALLSSFEKNENLSFSEKAIRLVGDGDADVATALNTGISFTAVSWGFRSHRELSAAGAREIVNNMRELSAVLERDGYL